MSKGEDLPWLLRCGECDGSGEIYHDSDIGTVYCDRCSGSGKGRLIRVPVALAKLSVILATLWVGAALVMRYLRP